MSHSNNVSAVTPSSLNEESLVTLKTRLKYTYVLAIGSESYPKSGEVRDKGHVQPSCLGSSCFTPSVAEWCAYKLIWRLTGTICWGSQPFFPGKGIKATAQKASLATMKTQICTCVTAASMWNEKARKSQTEHWLENNHPAEWLRVTQNNHCFLTIEVMNQTKAQNIQK